MTNSVSLLLLPALLALLGVLSVPLLLNWDKSRRSFVLAFRGLWLHKLRAFRTEARFLGRMGHARVVATTPAYADVHTFELAAGRFLTQDDDLKMSNYVVLGSGIADELFPFEDPLGQTVKLGSSSSNSFYYVVVGVLKDRMPTGGTGGSQAAEDFNNDVYLPLSTCKVRFGENIYLRSSGSRAGERVQL